ncbi:MAG: hypothetical protein ABIQ04_01455 [Candidatus Saccharimonadales bacterium]
MISERTIDERVRVIQRVCRGNGLAGDNDVSSWECGLFNCDTAQEVLEKLKSICIELAKTGAKSAYAINNALNVDMNESYGILSDRRDAYVRSQSFSFRTLIRNELSGAINIAVKFGSISVETHETMPKREESEVEKLRKRIKELEDLLGAIKIMVKSI